MSLTKSSFSALGRRDPTRTTGLRNAFARAMNKRFTKLTRDIQRVVVLEDGFGLLAAEEARVFKEKLGLGEFAAQQAFDFPTSQAKIEAFREWLQEMIDADILEVTERYQAGQPLEEAWTDIYIRQAYEQGVRRGRAELIWAGYTVPPIESGGLAPMFFGPFHADRVGILYARTFAELKGITSAMDSQISRVLAQGIAEGENPLQLARLLTRTITGPSGDLGITDTLGRYIPARRRANMLARTEIIRAHHMATIQEYRNWEVEDVYVKAEWVTAEDNRVCSICKALEGQVFTLDVAEKMIPRHPQCRCCTIPVDITDKIRRERARR